jgi:hypothetical protein
MNQEFHDHLDICEQCRNHPLHLCAIGARLLYATVAHVNVKGEPFTDADLKAAGQDWGDE